MQKKIDVVSYPLFTEHTYFFADNYNYKFSPKWAVGLHNDIIVEDFVVQEHLKSSGGGETLERSYPVASALMVSYKPGKHFSFMLGAGGEFAHTGNLFLVRIDAEYGYHISKKYEPQTISKSMHITPEL